MGFDGFPEEALLFFEGLEADNSKPYWTDHRRQYQEVVRSPMLTLLDALEPEFGAARIFRPHRDVRFSRDKSPYKTQIGAVVDDGGALYVQLSARGLLVAGGYHQAAGDQVERLRRAVADDRTGPELERLVERLEGAGFVVSGATLKTCPRGYAADHPRLRLLRHRTLTAARSWQPQPWLHTGECLDRVAHAWRDMRPLNAWLDRHVGPSTLPADRRP